MARPLRIEYPGAIYHLTGPGNARQAIFLDDEDRVRFLALLDDIVERYNWRFRSAGTFLINAKNFSS